jgi:hypothetical protein
MSHKEIIVAAIKQDAPDADPELVATSVAALDSIAYDDQFGVRRIPGSNRTVEEEARKLFVEKRQPAAPKETIEDERAKFSGYTRAEFERLPPDARLRIHGENTAPPPPKWKEKVPTVSRTDAIQWSGLSGADYDALPLQRRQEIVDEITFARMRGAK